MPGSRDRSARGSCAAVAPGLRRDSRAPAGTRDRAPCPRAPPREAPPPPCPCAAMAASRSGWRTSGTPWAARSVRIERAQTRQEAADIELQLGRVRPCKRVSDLLIDVDELLRRSKLRLAVAEADACIPEQLIEQQEVPLQIGLLNLCRLHLDTPICQIDLSATTERKLVRFRSVAFFAPSVSARWRTDTTDGFPPRPISSTMGLATSLTSA